MTAKKHREPGEAEKLVKQRRPRFYTYLMGLGETDQARADALGLWRDMAMDYRTGKVMPRLSLVTDPAISAEVRAARAELVWRLARDLADECGVATPCDKAA